MIGKKINEFDNSDGSVKSFGKLFPNVNLKGFTGTLEIGEIVGPETRRTVTELETGKGAVVYLDQKPVFEREFSEEARENLSKKQKSIRRFKYTVKEREGTFEKEFYFREDAAKFLGVSKGSVSHYVNKRHQNEKYDVFIEKLEVPRIIE